MTQSTETRAVDMTAAQHRNAAAAILDGIDWSIAHEARADLLAAAQVHATLAAAASLVEGRFTINDIIASA